MTKAHLIGTSIMCALIGCAASLLAPTMRIDLLFWGVGMIALVFGLVAPDEE
jgi:hypothetical protein